MLGNVVFGFVYMVKKVVLEVFDCVFMLCFGNQEGMVDLCVCDVFGYMGSVFVFGVNIMGDVVFVLLDEVGIFNFRFWCGC